MTRLVLLTAVAAAAAPLLPRAAPPEAPAATWPARFEGRLLRPLPATPEDARLARGFPGRIARFSDGRRQVVLRRVPRPTRQLHPARDCFAALGYRVAPLPMRRTPGGLMSCFEARRHGRTLRVCERITDARGESFPDVPGWWWPAFLGTSSGPWLAATVVEPLEA